MTNKFFESPQTGSVYVKVTEADPNPYKTVNPAFVAVRRIDEGSGKQYRITVRGDFADLVNLDLPGFSGVKDNDHRSIVVTPDLLDYYVDGAVKAVGGTVLPWKEVIGEVESSATIVCPECETVLHV